MSKTTRRKFLKNSLAAGAAFAVCVERQMLTKKKAEIARYVVK